VMCKRLVTNELSLVVILMDSLRCHEYKFTCKRLKCVGYYSKPSSLAEGQQTVTLFCKLPI
jgi:hypothetical protein